MKRLCPCMCMLSLALVSGGSGCGTWPSPPDDSDGTSFPPASQPASESDYDQALARLRRGECRGFVGRVGTCGDFLMIIDSTGHSSVVSYYDPQTRMLVGQTRHDDTGHEEHFLQRIECAERDITETILCQP